MAPLFFCNIGWMSRYEGLDRQPDRIVGGGSYVDETSRGGEVCNFVIARDERVYGHVETISGEVDREIHIEALGAGTDDSVSGIDVVWTATHPDEGGRRVVGWYKDATVFRHRQTLKRGVSRQHSRDNLSEYRIVASASNVHRVEIKDRKLRMGWGSGWMGQTPWWIPPADPSPAIADFVERVREDIASPKRQPRAPENPEPSKRSAAPASEAYVRYVEKYELKISPRHHDLQTKFEKFIRAAGCRDIEPNVDRADLRYVDTRRGAVLAEIKPCDVENVRFAVRTAIGQLLDYEQRSKIKSDILIVVERAANAEDRTLATLNGIGLAHPSDEGFALFWPD